MTGLRRLPIIAIAALLAAGCGSTTPTAAPIESISAVATTAGPTPTTPSELPTSPAATSIPGPECSPLTRDTWTPTADYSLRIPLGYENIYLDVTRVSSLTNPTEVVEFEAREPYLEDPGRLVGRWDVSLLADIGFVDSVALVSGSAVLKASGRKPIRVSGTVGRHARLDRPVVRFEVPDAHGLVVVDFTVEWVDDCYRYRVEGPAAFEMATAAHAARCPKGSKGFAEHFAAMGQPPLRVGDLGVDMARHETIGLWTRYSVWVTGGGALSMWDAETESAIGQAGSVLRVAPVSSDLRIQSLLATYYRRSDVIDARPADNPRRVFRATADPYQDGHLDLLLPSEPGRYVADLSFQWETPCAYGGAFAGVSIDVE